MSPSSTEKGRGRVPIRRGRGGSATRRPVAATFKSKRGPVADARHFGNTHDEAMADYANARLIAASPSLLAEAKRDLEYVRDMKRALAGMGRKNAVQFSSTEMREKALVSAIRRATGVPHFEPVRHRASRLRAFGELRRAERSGRIGAPSCRISMRWLMSGGMRSTLGAAEPPNAPLMT